MASKDRVQEPVAPEVIAGEAYWFYSRPGGGADGNVMIILDRDNLCVFIGLPGVTVTVDRKEIVTARELVEWLAANRCTVTVVKHPARSGTVSRADFTAKGG
jgi:hypothetical protein